jgi:hypothetical protein
MVASLTHPGRRPGGSIVGSEAEQFVAGRGEELGIPVGVDASERQQYVGFAGRRRPRDQRAVADPEALLLSRCSAAETKAGTAMAAASRVWQSR